MEQGFPSSLRTVRDNRIVRSISAKLNRSSEWVPFPLLPPGQLLLLLRLRSTDLGIISSGIDSLIIQIINKRSADGFGLSFSCCCCCWPGQKRRLMARFSFEKCSGAGQRQTDRLQSQSRSRSQSGRVERDLLESRFESEKCVCAVGGVAYPLNFAAKR